MKSKKVFVFSDTHFFCRSSKLYGKSKAEFRNRLMEQIINADIVVMNGDIFDLIFPANMNLFLSREDAIKHASDKAIKWLEDLCKSCPGKEIYFNLGNHENIKKFWDDLQEVEAKFHGNEGICKFTAKKHFLKLGSNLFFHGDLELAKTPIEQRDIPKVKHLGTASMLEKANFHLEYLVQGVMNISNATGKICRRVLNEIAGNKKLNEKYPSLLKQCKKFFFGHTHIPIFGHIDPAYKDAELYNTGSSTHHGHDWFITGDIEVKFNGEYGDMTNLKRLSLFGAKVIER